MGGPGSGPRPGQKNRLGTGKGVTPTRVRSGKGSAVRTKGGKVLGRLKKGGLGFVSGFTDVQPTSSKRASVRNAFKLKKKYGGAPLRIKRQSLKGLSSRGRVRRR